MTNEDFKQYCIENNVVALSEEMYEEAFMAMKKLGRIDAIIHNTQGIQEDVIRYQMICEVIENELV